MRFIFQNDPKSAYILLERYERVFSHSVLIDLNQITMCGHKHTSQNI